MGWFYLQIRYSAESAYFRSNELMAMFCRPQGEMTRFMYRPLSHGTKSIRLGITQTTDNASVSTADTQRAAEMVQYFGY